MEEGVISWGLITMLFLFGFPPATSNYLRDPDVCGNPKCKGFLKFGYLPRVKYKYDYTVLVNTIFDGTESVSSNMTINASFFIQFRTPCEGILKVLNASISGGEDSKQSNYTELFNSKVSQNILRFAFQDGKIYQICPKDNEHVWVFNFKKGILSTLQNTMKRFDVDTHISERDINGDCKTVYHFRQQNGTRLVVSKKKYIASCTNRYSFYSIIPTSNYIFQKKYHKWTPMNSTVNCHQEVDNKVLSKVNCFEDHIYQPFNNHMNGVRTLSSSSMVLVSEEDSNDGHLSEIDNLGTVKNRDDLLFNHRRPRRATHDDIFECKYLLNRLCTLSMEEFQAEFPDVFNQFIHIARDLSTPALNQLFKDSNSTCITGRKHMKDALPFIRSRASTHLMTEVILNREISEPKIQEWLTLMAFFPKPDGETIASVSNLMTQNKVEHQAMLSVSSMVHSYCENHDDCFIHPSVQNIVTTLEVRLNNSLKYDKRERLFALKGIQNAGVMTPTMEDSLKKCILNKDEDTEMKINCIHAHRRMPCGTNKNQLSNIFANTSINQEIRIAAYIQLMRCPTYNVLKTIKNALDIEEYNQVGSFVWSHLKNLIKSSMPNRMEIQAMLQDEELSDKFEKDIRKFSKHYESSFFLNRYGVGGIVENFVIFSEESYIPRTLTTNISINIFGESLNFLEVTLRLEGLETYIENVFNNNKFFKNEQIYNTFNFIRVLRQSSQTLNDLINNIQYSHKNSSLLKVSVSLKTFGNEVKYYELNEDSDFKKVLDSLNPLKLIKDFLSGQEVTIERSTMLMDTSYVTPMTCGLPLKLNVVGTAAININAMGFVNATSFSSDGEIEIDGKLNPSIGFHFEAYMFTDAFVDESGVKFKGTVFTSTALEGNFNSKGYKEVTISFNLPMEKSQIFHAETQMSLIQGKVSIPLENSLSRRVNNRICSWSILDETIGLKLCFDYLLPNTNFLLESPLFIFSGPLKVGLTLEKSDPTAHKYIIQYKMEAVSNKTLITFKFETPGSETKRGMEAVIDLDTQSQNLTLAYQSNLSTVQAQGFYRNTPSEKFVYFGLDINGKKHIDIHIGMEIAKEKYGYTYSPKLLFAINNKRIASLTGSYRWVEKKGVSQCDIDLDFQTNRFMTKIAGYVRMNDVSIATHVKIDYSFNGGKLQTVSVLLKLGDKSSKFLTQFFGTLQLESSAYPQINMVTTLKYHRAQGHVDCRIDLSTDPYVTDEKQRLYILWAFQYLKTYIGTKLNTSLQVTKPVSDIDFKLGFTHQDSADSTTSSVLLKYATGKEIEAILDLLLPHEKMFQFESKLRIIIPQAIEPLNIFTKIQEKNSRGEYDIEFVGTWFSGHNLTIRGVYLDRSTLSMTSHSLKLLARSLLFNDIHITTRLIISQQEYRIDLKAEHNEIRYGVLLSHSSQDFGMYKTFGEVLYNNTFYTFTNYIDIIRRQTVLELHLDKYRDVRISLKGFTNKTKLDAGLDVKWDANRNPTQKLIIVLQTNSHGNFNYDGKFMLEYPGRVVTANGYTQNKDRDYMSSVQIDWAPKQGITIFLHAMHDIRRKGLAKLFAKVVTPFSKWEHTSVHYELKMQSQSLQSHGQIELLDNQKINMELSYSYLFSDDKTDLNFKSLLNSSMAEITSMHLIFKHNHAALHYSTGFSMQVNPNITISVGSAGEISYPTTDSSKYQISLTLNTPFSLAKQASLSLELNLFPQSKIKGNIHLLGNGKKSVVYIEGALKYLNESKLNILITTPFEKYKFINAKYAFSSSSKHFIIDIKSPAATVGTELNYVYHNTSNFDLKLHVHTSLIHASSLIIVGKINTDTVDLRFGWNKLMVGVIGRSHYLAWNDVDYSIQLFTPVEGFHKCSAIAKLIFGNKVDFEASVNFADKKIGLRIQARENPEDDFAIPSISESNSKNGTLSFSEPEFGKVYWRGVMQLDSLLYPTVYAYSQVNEDESEYFLTTFFNFPFGQLKIKDDIVFEDVLHIQNSLLIESTCDCLKEIRSFYYLGGDWEEERKTVKSNLEISKISYNQTSQVKMNLIYDFEPINEDSELEGKYDLKFDLETPFKLLPFCHTEFKLQAEQHSYSSNLTIEIKNSSVYLDGTLEFDETSIESNIGIQLTTPILVLPMCRMTINKDFSDFEKKLDIGLALPNEKGDGFVNYGVGGTWYNSGPHYMKYFGHIVTPYLSVGTIKGGFQMKNDIEEEQFFVDLFLKYSISSEIKMTSTLKGNKLLLQADSTFEGLRDINITTNINNNGKVKTVEMTLSASKDYQLLCWATYAHDRPTTVEIKMFKKSTKEEIFGIVANIFSKEQGYDMDALFTHNNRKIRLTGNYIIWEDIGKQLDAVVTSTYPGYEGLNLSAILLTRTGNLFVTKLVGNITSKLVNSEFEVDMNISLEEDCGIIQTGVSSPYFSSSGEIIWTNKFLEHMSLIVNGECAFGNTTKDISINLYTWNVEKEFQDISIGSDINYNQKSWWFCGNLTVLSPSWSDIIVLSHLLLPQKMDEMHTVLAKLNYLNDWSYFTHLLKYYSKEKAFAFQSVSEIELSKDLSKGALLVETREYRFFDKFYGHTIEDGYTLNNLLQSTNMKDDLVMKLLYKKPSKSHLAWVDVCYPPSIAIVESFIDFIEINNMKARLNCTTPFEAFPKVQLLLNIITGLPLYQRYGEVKWKNTSAIFNYTHASVINNSNQITDGDVIVDFPLASRHIGHLKYKYESTSMKATGYSDLYYNHDYIMGGNYTRLSKQSVNTKEDVINILVNNTYMPAGITYAKKIKNDSSRHLPFMDLRRVEIFKLNNSTGFNLTGEYEIESSETDKLATIRAYMGKRNLSLNVFFGGDKEFETHGMFYSKSQFWIGYDLSSRTKEDVWGQFMEINLTYPRRHFTMNTDYFWTDEDIFAQMIIHPNMKKMAKYLGGEVSWKTTPDNPLTIASIKILHPSFNKNITLSAIYNRNDTALMDVDVVFEYSTDPKKKLLINSTLLKLSHKFPGRYYELIALGSHPATGLVFTGTSAAKLFNGILELNKNVSYKRSYAPLHYWSSNLMIDFHNKHLELKKKSLRESSELVIFYCKVMNDHIANLSYMNGDDRKIIGNFSINFVECKTHLSVDFTPDSSEQLHMHGQFMDNRHVMMNIWRNYGLMSIKDFTFYLKLNTSRMLTSEFAWRPEIPYEVIDMLHSSSNNMWAYILDTANFWTMYIKNEIGDTIMDLWLDSKPILQDFIDDVRNVDYLQEDIQYFKQILNDAYKNNEFYMQDIYNMYILLAEEMSFKDKMANFPKIVSELWEMMGETGETIRQSIIWAIDMIQNIYNKIVLFAREIMSGETLNKVTLYIQQIAGQYDKMIKDVHVSVLHYMEYLWQEASDFLSLYWSKLLNAVEPTFIQVTHHIETVFWEGSKKTLEFLFQGPAELMKASVFTSNSNLTRDLDKFYKELTKNDFLTNIKKYSQLFLEIIKEKYFSFVPFGYELNEIGAELMGEVKELHKLPVVNFTIEASLEVYNKVLWLYNYFNIGEKLQKAIPLLYKIIDDASHTALENEMINHRGKTSFIFDIDNGIIKLEQKLPVPWHAFNETPVFEEIPEYKFITRIQKWFAPSNKTFWTYFYKLAPLINPDLWLPPFESQAIIAGMQHFITFDKTHFALRGSCSLLLSKDYVDDSFSLVLKYQEGKHLLILIADTTIITFDPVDKTVSLNKAGALSFPLQVGTTYIMSDEGLIKVVSDKGFKLECNLEYDVCTFSLSGWYFGKVAGLLGSMDNEPANDFLTSKGVLEKNLTLFAQSWALGECSFLSKKYQKSLNAKNADFCSSIFQSKTSTFSACYPMVEPQHFNMMCRRSLPGIKNEICSSAYSYLKDCQGEHTPLSMPSFCVRCSINNKSVEEGEFRRLEKKDVVMSSDVVFIIEAKECNQYMREKRLVHPFISILTKEFSNVGLTNNRFAVISFGGDGIFNPPRKIFVDNKFFTTDRNIVNYFENIPSGKGNSDIFAALSLASSLRFRPGVSKTFILIPCSDCDPSNMSLEYSVLQQVLTEKDVKLHILMNADFDLEKLRVSKVFYGLDSEKAYTKNDFKLLKGDMDLRRQIKLTKSMLGHCTPLALSTNGTIFTSKKFGSESIALVKKFCNVFARRIASSALPNKCQNCECLSNSDGVPVVDCLPCSQPTPIYSDFDFRDNTTMSLFERFDPIGDSDFGF